jgi:CRP-like cAMP-binding protein
MTKHSRNRTESRPKEPGKPLEFPAGAKLFDSDQPCRRVYLLRSGQVQLVSERGAIVDYLCRGDLFGEGALLGPRRGGPAAKSLSTVAVSTFGKSQLLDYVQGDRRFAAELLSALARRLGRYERTIQDAVVERAERRLALLLSRFMPARPRSGWVQLLFSPSNSELARTIGSTRWRIAHFMGHFQRLGWLERRPELWVSREGLREYLEGKKGTDADA